MPARLGGRSGRVLGWWSLARERREVGRAGWGGLCLPPWGRAGVVGKVGGMGRAMPSPAGDADRTGRAQREGSGETELGAIAAEDSPLRGGVGGAEWVEGGRVGCVMPPCGGCQPGWPGAAGGFGGNGAWRNSGERLPLRGVLVGRGWVKREVLVDWAWRGNGGVLAGGRGIFRGLGGKKRPAEGRCLSDGRFCYGRRERPVRLTRRRSPGGPGRCVPAPGRSGPNRRPGRFARPGRGSCSPPARCSCLPAGKPS